VLDARGLRRFGLTTAAILVALFGVALPWLLERPWPVWPWIVGGVLCVWALVLPSTLDGVYRGWMWIGILLGRVMTPIVMSLLFFVVILPIALGMKLARRDPMRRHIDRAVTTYRIASAKTPAAQLEKPF
jgi:hypothetical protein